MATLWALGDADNQDRRAFIATGSLAEFCQSLALSEDQYVTPPGEWPFFEPSGADWNPKEHAFAVIELTEQDVGSVEWSAGFYFLKLGVDEARRRLGLAGEAS